MCLHFFREHCAQSLNILQDALRIQFLKFLLVVLKFWSFMPFLAFFAFYREFFKFVNEIFYKTVKNSFLNKFNSDFKLKFLNFFRFIFNIFYLLARFLVCFSYSVKIFRLTFYPNTVNFVLCTFVRYFGIFNPVLKIILHSVFWNSYQTFVNGILIIIIFLS